MNSEKITYKQILSLSLWNKKIISDKFSTQKKNNIIFEK